ncbi:hypothetical protein ANCCEY_07795 [Ancylostoma ceylanicum]|uniref:Uncharacterized protein n=1 Tax=Ancylostoma ceylanicum TaxID=53326 RepID=A0A0D6LPF4_9BILA|nr:hypothetical protein ANCCEY_07795 [Ancylostoma ceylanicum]
MVDKEIKRKQRKLGEKLLRKKSASKSWREHKQAIAEKREKALLGANEELKKLQESTGNHQPSGKGLLNPLDAHHHLRSDDVSIPFREGVILDKPVKADRGMLCDVGLEKELELEDKIQIPPATRVTVEITNLGTESKRYRGKLSNARKVRAKTGKYWGYSVQLATSLKEVIDRKKFDVIIGTSPRGEPVSNMYVNTLNDVHVLLVFGGVAGVDAALEAEEALAETRAEEAFDRLINSLPFKGTNSERVEENVFVTLAEVTMRLQQLFS